MDRKIGPFGQSRQTGPREQDLLKKLQQAGTMGPVSIPEHGPPTACPKCKTNLFEMLESVQVRFRVSPIIGQDIPPLLIPFTQFRCRECGELLAIQEIKKQYDIWKAGNGEKQEPGKIVPGPVQGEKDGAGKSDDSGKSPINP